MGMSIVLFNFLFFALLTYGTVKVKYKSTNSWTRCNEVTEGSTCFKNTFKLRLYVFRVYLKIYNIKSKGWCNRMGLNGALFKVKNLSREREIGIYEEYLDLLDSDIELELADLRLVEDSAIREQLFKGLCSEHSLSCNYITADLVLTKYQSYKKSRVVEWDGANHIHAWFCKRYDCGGKFNGTYFVYRLDLEALRDACQGVLDKPETASKVFLGGIALFVDEEFTNYYFNEIKYTLRSVQTLLRSTDFRREVLVYKFSS